MKGSPTDNDSYRPLVIDTWPLPFQPGVGFPMTDPTSSPLAPNNASYDENAVFTVIRPARTDGDRDTTSIDREAPPGPTGEPSVSPQTEQSSPRYSGPDRVPVGKSSQVVERPARIEEASETRLNVVSSMLKKELPNVLPLHLVPIDSFFLADDQPRYPMTSIIRLEFSGEIDRVAFEAALQGATRRHPLTRAIIKPLKRGLPCWVHSDVMPTVDWGPIDKPVTFASEEFIDLTRESGLRFWIRSDPDQTAMTVQVHHACTDGTGVYRFLGDLLAIYAGETVVEGQPIPELAKIDLGMLRRRRTRFAELAKGATRAQFLRHGVMQGLKIFGKRIRPLTLPRSRNKDGQPRTPFPGVFSVRFDKHEHKLLRAIASDRGAMLNDLLMAEMFRTIVRWNEKHSGRSENGTLRVMMPSDLREQQDYPMPATNMTAYTFVTRRADECRDLSELLKSIREETARIKHAHSGRSFMDAVQFADYGKSMLKMILGMNRCISSTILSNVGDPSKRFTATLPRDKGRIVAGNLTLEDVTGVPPLRVQTRATLAIFSYLRKLTLSVRCDPYEFTPEDSQQFVEMYAEGLRSHIIENSGER